MRHFALGSILLLASAQHALAVTINVTVGGPGVLKFNPQFVDAAVGDVVQFIFQQKNHTVTQSTLASPCSPLAGGFDSNFRPVPDNAASFPMAKLDVTTTAPVWAYCRQGAHCKSSGMVFAVNPGSQFAAFQAAATGGTSPSSVSPSPSTATSPVPTPSGSSTDHKIIVGGSGVVFSPNNISAKPGDTVTFEFRQKNHTVTASSFSDPCNGLPSGFDTGFKPVAEGVTSFPTFTLAINDTTPVWGFCKQGNHCSQGMVFAINAVESSDKNFAAFQALAKGSNGNSSTNPYPTSAAWRPGVGSSSMAVILGLSAAVFLL